MVVDPESNYSTFTNFLDLTAEMVSTTIMVTGVRFVGTDFLGLSCLCLFITATIFWCGIHFIYIHVVNKLALYEIRGMNLPDLSCVSRWEGHLASWLRSPCLFCGNWCTCDNNCCRKMSFVVWRLAPQGAVCCHGLVPCRVQGVCVASALAPFGENGIDCDHRDQQQWVHCLSLLVVTDFA